MGLLSLFFFLHWSIFCCILYLGSGHSGDMVNRAARRLCPLQRFTAPLGGIPKHSIIISPACYGSALGSTYHSGGLLTRCLNPKVKDQQLYSEFLTIPLPSGQIILTNAKPVTNGKQYIVLGTVHMLFWRLSAPAAAYDSSACCPVFLFLTEAEAL